MPRYSGSTLALGALSRAIGDAFSGAAEGTIGAEQIRARQAIEAQNAQRIGLEQGRFAMDQQLQPFKLAEAQERIAGAPIRREFLQAEAAKMRQPATQQIGDSLIERGPQGWRTAYQRPQSPAEALSDFKLKQEQQQATSLGEFRDAYGKAMQDPDPGRRVKALSEISGKYAPLLDPDLPGKMVLEEIKSGRMQHGVVGLIEAANDPRRSPEERASYGKMLKQYQEIHGGGVGAEPFGKDAIDIMANTYLQTGAVPSMGMGRASTEARIKVINRASEIAREKGLPFDEQAARTATFKANQAELTQLQAQRGKVLSFARTADLNLTVAEDLSKKVDQSGMPVLNRWLNAGRRGVQGDTDLVAFDAAVRTAINEFAKVTSSATGGGVTSDAARKEVESMLNTAQTRDQFDAVVKVLRRDLTNREKGYEEQIEKIQKATRLGAGSAPTAPSDSPQGERIKVIGPNGPGTVPAGTDLSKYPGWKLAQ